MPLFETYPTEAEPLVNFSWVDYTQKVGYVKLYGFTTTVANTTKDYHLGTEAHYSSTIETSQTLTGPLTGGETANDLDFDWSPFVLPQRIGGAAIVYFTQAVSYDSYAGYTTTTIKIRKWDGSTETEIASAIGERIDSKLSENLIVIPITIPETHFKKGETLRLSTLQTHTHRSSNPQTTNVFTIGNSPLNRDGTYIVPSTDDPDTTTQLVFFCPFPQTQ